MSKPTFDEWYVAKHGRSLQGRVRTNPMWETPRIICEAISDYLHEMVQPEAEAKITAAPTLYSDTDLQRVTGGVIDRRTANPQWNIYEGMPQWFGIDRAYAPPLTWKTERREERMQPHEWMELCARLPQPIESGFAHGRPYDHYEPIGDEV